MTEAVIGIDLGGTNVRAALVSRDGAVLAKDSRPCQGASGPEAVMAAMSESVSAVLKGAGLAPSGVLAAGIGAPGPLNWQTGVVYRLPNLPGWHNVPLADAMSERLGFTCYVDNDANCACYGEYWSGAGVGTQTMCLLTLGTGVGGGVVVFGKLLRGLDGTAGELGHMTVAKDGRRCGCGARGCLEAYGSVSGMVRTAIEGMLDGESTVLTQWSEGDYRRISGKMIHEGMQAGDLLCERVIRETGVWLGTAIADLINIFNPERIILAGGMTEAGDALFAPIRETAKSMAFEVPAARAEIIAAAHGADAGVIGAAGCALARLEGRV